MKVTVVRTGGFAGIERHGEADTASDPILRGLVARVDLGAVPQPGRVPDQFLYEIDINGHTLLVGESRLTGPLRELVHHVLAR
jgi:Emfourin